MAPLSADFKRMMELSEAFRKDGFAVRKIITRFGRIGMMAEHRTAFNYDTGQRKKAYYLEGSGYEMGYLLGFLAEREISAMAVDFSNKVVFSFIGSKLLEKITILQEAFLFILHKLSQGMYKDLPAEIREEIQGVYDGCKKHNPGTKVTLERLIALNMGFDTLCAMIYTGNFLQRTVFGIEPQDIRMPILCNGFSLFGKQAGYGHYFGRDFMFPTADTFQDMAAMMVCNPVTQGKKSFPFVSVTAPGMVGSISAMNSQGAALGVDMSPGGNCNAAKVGTNSLLTVRTCAQFGSCANHMVQIIQELPRGVSWNYILADGRHDKACVVEAGASRVQPDFLEELADEWKALLPDGSFLAAHLSAEYRNGVMVRWHDYRYPLEYLEFNPDLWAHYNRTHSPDAQFYPDMYAQEGFINRTRKDRNCPSVFYFAPQREENPQLVLVTNHYIIPEMRLYTMHPWTSRIVGEKINDIQWRYDELNAQILQAIRENSMVDFAIARRLIDFLAPYGRFPDYYADNPRSRDGKQIRIEGSTSLFDLKNRLVESHYGYFCDDWVRITLPNYMV